jgi:hypothetical protein
VFLHDKPANIARGDVWGERNRDAAFVPGAFLAREQIRLRALHDEERQALVESPIENGLDETAACFPDAAPSTNTPAPPAPWAADGG